MSRTIAQAVPVPREITLESFADLVAIRELRPIRSERDRRRAAALIDRLAVKTKLTADQTDYLEALSTLVEAYEAEHHAPDAARVTPLDALKELLSAHEMSGSDLGRLLGNRELGPAILRGDRELSKRHIRKLAEHFAVSPALFL